MPRTIRNAANDSKYITRANYLMESKRLELLNKAIQSAYGLTLSIGELQKLDQTICKGIDKLLKQYDPVFP